MIYKFTTIPDVVYPDAQPPTASDVLNGAVTTSTTPSSSKRIRKKIASHIKEDVNVARTINVHLCTGRQFGVRRCQHILIGLRGGGGSG